MYSNCLDIYNVAGKLQYQHISDKLVFTRSYQMFHEIVSLDLFINNLQLSVTSSQALLFADDTKSLLNIKSPLDNQNLQTDLDTVCAWGRLWNMVFNEGKCFHIQFFQTLNLYSPLQYLIDGSTITNCSHHKDFGVSMSNDLSQSRPCNYIASKAYKEFGMIK